LADGHDGDWTLVRKEKQFKRNLMMKYFFSAEIPGET
jgi:hypothetical protein